MVEVLTVILIISILVTLALPKFGTMKERALDREAKANLRLIQAAEKIYRMELGVFWPPSATPETTVSLNTELKLDLSPTNWSYQASSNNGAPPLDAQATRANPPSGWDRTYYIDDEEEQACCCPQGSAPDSVCPSQDLCTNLGQSCPPVW